jgi:hypothetical protein
VVRRAAKVDGNQAEIVECLRAIPDVSVAITAGLGAGFPDLVVGYRGFNFMLEIKRDAAQELTDDQKAFHAGWRGQVHKVCSLKEIVTLMTGWNP